MIIDKLLDYHETAEICGMSVSWVRKEIRAGRLKTVKLGKAVRIEPSDLREFIDKWKRKEFTVYDFVPTLNLPARSRRDAAKLKVIDPTGS